MRVPLLPHPKLLLQIYGTTGFCASLCFCLSVFFSQVKQEVELGVPLKRKGKKEASPMILTQFPLITQLFH